MAFYPWNESYSLRIPRIDIQHKQLVSLIDQLYEAMKSGKGRDAVGPVLRSLVAYTQVHFATEEQLLTEHAFPGWDAHRRQHDDFTAKVLDYKKRFEASTVSVSVEVVNMLKDWLNTHILGTDKQYADFLVERGVQ